VTAVPTPRPPLDRSRLVATAPRWRVEVVDRAGSTNRLVGDRARAGERPGLVVVAEHQTAGRGRLDRTWETPARVALTFSVLLRPDVPLGRWPWLPLLAGVACDEALAVSAATADVGLKWPNDVLVGGRKLGGILTELVETPTGPAAVLGIGLNVATAAADLPVPTATSLAVEGYDVDRTDLLLDLLDALARWLDDWAGADGAARLRAAYQQRCATVGQQVRVDLPGGRVLDGTAELVDDHGRLVVDGVPVAAGDVVHTRSVP
jgi:BirA family transcriptional regulator, biotin operon repressor / biotin---[acetyl-CoA-carboxylase] ligase